MRKERTSILISILFVAVLFVGNYQKCYSQVSTADSVVLEYKDSLKSKLNAQVLQDSSLFRGTLLQRTKIPISIYAIKDTINAIINHNLTYYSFVSEDVSDKYGNILIKKSTPVDASYVREYERGIGVAGTFRAEFRATTAVDGSIVWLRGYYFKEGLNRRKKVIIASVVTGVFLSPLFLFLLTIKGTPALTEPEIISAYARTLGKQRIELK